jgi:hypothetical protein
VQAGYLAGNPLALSRQRTRKIAPRVTRYLEPGLWQEVKNFIASMPQETARDRAHYHRVRWLFTLLYLGGLRIAEAGGNTMGQFFVRRDADGTMRWWLTVPGKGDKERLVPATRELMTELSRYRQHLGMTALPSPNETTPLVLPIGSTAGRTAGSTTESDRTKTEGPSRRPLTRAALHTIVKDVFGVPPAGCANAAKPLPHGRTCSGRPRRTGCGTAPVRTWPTIRSICAWCATTSVTRR